MPAPAQDSPLGARELDLLAAGAARARSLRRASWLAYANGSTLLACALACLPFALLDDRWLLLAVIALGAGGAAELRGARMLRRHDLRAPNWLAANQLALLALIAVYCGAHALGVANGVSELKDASPALADQLRDVAATFDVDEHAIDSALRAAIKLFYASVFVACALYQGLCAHYYRTRGAVLRAFVAETPAWVREALRRLSG
jgi:hypothetical protein